MFHEIANKCTIRRDFRRFGGIFIGFSEFFSEIFHLFSRNDASREKKEKKTMFFSDILFS